MPHPRRLAWLLALFVLSAAGDARAQRVLEALGRGVVAVRQADGKVFVGWRLLATDPDGVAFNVYRSTAGGKPKRLNRQPLTGPTHFEDESADRSRVLGYSVRPVVKGREQDPSAAFALPAQAPARPYLAVPLQTPPGYAPNDGSVGDLDGDGEYEIVLHQAGRGRDNSRAGMTDPPILQAYRLDGKLLWTIQLGRNVREGAHYTQFMVYDLDGDGRAEVACRTADGTVDGQGKVIGDPKADWRSPEGTFLTLRGRDGGERRQDVSGYILKGPEYLTIFDGLTGAALATADYVPQRHPATHSPTPEQMEEAWGDGWGNRVDRFLAAVAYLDGSLPSLVMCRGYYTRAVLAAWNWRDGKLTRAWTFDSDDGTPGHQAYRGQGNHNLSVADVDGDGRDEIVYGAAAIDDDGKGLHSTGWGHGDALHVSDLDPDHPGLEVFNIQERFGDAGANFRDARTGRELWKKPSVRAATAGGDAGEGPGRANAVNIDPRHRGNEAWVAGAGMRGLWSAKGEKISDNPPRACNFAVWWDGDLQREILDRNVISKWSWEKETLEPVVTAEGCTSNNGTKATPTLSGDLFGDWREEVIWPTTDGQELRIYTTTVPTKHRIHTLMHDAQYRLAVAWQNVAYNQPPHPSFYLGDEAPLPARPLIRVPVRPRR
jgi:rhamnogalacturonan endolyase